MIDENRDKIEEDSSAFDKDLEEQEIKRKYLHIAWRRNQILSMLADGMTQTAIAEKLQIADSTVHEDVTYLRTTAKERLKEYIEEQLPFAIQQCLIRLQKSLHETVQLREKLKDEPKLQLQATQIIDDIAVKIVDISAHIEPVNNLLSHIIKKTEKDVDNLKKQVDKAKEEEEVKAVNAQSTTAAVVLESNDSGTDQETSNSDTDAGTDSTDNTDSTTTTDDDTAGQDSRVF